MSSSFFLHPRFCLFFSFCLFHLVIQSICLPLATDGYTTEDLVFQWKEGDPVQVVSNLHLPRFTLQRHSVDYCTSKTNTGEYSCIVVELMFRREFSYYLIQIYIPCCMLVIVSWVSFWLDPNAIPARVSLGVTTLLTMATQISGINASLPPVSYTKAIDVWTGCCLTFVFGALLEFALVNYASRSDCHRAAAEAKLWQQAFMSTQQDHQHQEGESSRKQQHQLHHQQQTQSKSHPASISSSHQPVHRSSLRSTCSMLKTSTSAHSLDNDLTHEPAADAPVNSLNSVSCSLQQLHFCHFAMPVLSNHLLLAVQFTFFTFTQNLLHSHFILFIYLCFRLQQQTKSALPLLDVAIYRVHLRQNSFLHLFHHQVLQLWHLLLFRLMEH